jgi:hypothetical protein
MIIKKGLHKDQELKRKPFKKDKNMKNSPSISSLNSDKFTKMTDDDSIAEIEMSSKIAIEAVKSDPWPVTTAPTATDRLLAISENNFSKEYQDLLCILKVLGKVKVGEKVNFTTEDVMDGNSLLTIFWRTVITGESRKTNLVVIQEMMNRCKEFVRSPRLTQREKQHLLSDIPPAIKGLENMMNTYRKDVFHCSRLEDIIRQLKDFIATDSTIVL